MCAVVYRGRDGGAPRGRWIAGFRAISGVQEFWRGCGGCAGVGGCKSDRYLRLRAFQVLKKVGSSCTPRGRRFCRARGRAAQRRTKTRGERAKTGRIQSERVRGASCGRAARATWVSSHCGPGVCELGWGSRRAGSASWKRGALVMARNREHHKALFGRRGDAAELSCAGVSCAVGPDPAIRNVKFEPSEKIVELTSKLFKTLRKRCARIRKRCARTRNRADVDFDVGGVSERLRIGVRGNGPGALRAPWRF